jgi:hypothetical protein
MTQTYLIQCECGAKVAVEATQAGQSIDCKCGAPVEVPTMRKLSQLERVAGAQADAGPTWTRMQGSLFATGAVILLVSVALVVLSRWNRPAEGSTELLPYDSATDQFLANMTPEQTLEVWQGMAAAPLVHNSHAPHLVNRRRLAQADRFFQLGVAGGFVGLVFLAASMICKSRS